MIRAGKLDQIIAIQALTSGVDGMGSPTESWATATGAPTRAERMPLRGAELVQAGKLEAKRPCKFRIRRWAGLNETYRITHGGLTYKILSIEDYDRSGRDMVVWAEAEV